LRPAKSCRAYAGRFAAPVRLSAAFAELRKRSSLFIGICDDMSPERTSRIDRQFCLAFLSVPRSQLKKYSKILKLLAARMKYAILLL
jgi:predicted AAA+ superfamily ATPase